MSFEKLEISESFEYMCRLYYQIIKYLMDC